jgi:hypothetical protein
MLPDLVSSILMACDNELPLAPELQDEQLIYYISSIEHMSLRDNWQDTTHFNENLP